MPLASRPGLRREESDTVRALILVLAMAVVALAASIVIEVDRRPNELRQTGARFDIHALLTDARAGEYAQYREAGSGQRLRWVVADRPPPLPQEAPHILIRRDRLTREGQLATGAGAQVTYSHQLVHHGWFPFMAPEVPSELDRVWIIRGIRQARLRLRGGDVMAWRVEFLDPALPADMDTVVGWFDASVPVFGLLRLERHGETWDFEQGSERRG